MECNLVCLEVNLSLFMNLYSPLVYPKLRREHFITERRHNQRKTMTNLHSELSVKCTFFGTTATKRSRTDIHLTGGHFRDVQPF